MIKFVRIFTFLLAAILTVVSIFYMDAEQEFALAQRAFRKGDNDQALRLARRANRAFSADADKTEAYYLQALAAEKMGWTEKAVYYLDKLLKLDSVKVEALLFRGELNYRLDECNNALKDLNKGLDLTSNRLPKNKQAYYYSQRGLAYLSVNKLDDAENDAFEALSLYEKSSEAHDLMSKVYEQKGNIELALDECEKAYNLMIEKDKLSFMTPKGKALSERLVDLRVKKLRMN